MSRNGYLGSFDQKSDPAIRSVDLDFLWDGYISTIGWCLQHIFDVFVHKLQLTLWPWPSTFWPWRCLMDQTSYIQRMCQFLASYGYPFPSYGWLNNDHITITRTVTAHAPCHVTCAWRVPQNHTWQLFTPNYLFTIQLIWGYDDD